MAKDVCDAIGTRVDNSVRNLEPFETANTPLKGFTRGAVLLSESGLYAVILRSNSPTAKRFRIWVTSEVLPTIRKTGTYSVTKPAGFLKLRAARLTPGL